MPFRGRKCAVILHVLPAFQARMDPGRSRLFLRSRNLIARFAGSCGVELCSPCVGVQTPATPGLYSSPSGLVSGRAAQAHSRYAGDPSATGKARISGTV